MENDLLDEKKMKTITAHMVVKNEERWLWYSISSIIDYVDKLLIYDTGSIDGTVDIIKSFLEIEKYKDKIIFEEKKNVNKENFHFLRQEQIERTKSDFFLVVDGDEIWYGNVLKNLHRLINENDVKCDLVAVKFINCAGDVYHYRAFERESYRIKDITGSITIRLYSMKITGIKCAGVYGVEGYFDYYDKPVQNSIWSIVVLEGHYLHMSFLQRSGDRKGDIKIPYRRRKLGADWDFRFDKDFAYPEVFFLPRPEKIPSPWRRMSTVNAVLCMFRKMITKMRC